ncbi:MAG: hypothetical protein VKJ02_16885 [Snowella sp.]|nr:hypothetical protein [Snowella sp.]
MSNIKPVANEFAGIEGNYGIVNQGTGYAVVNILTGEMKAHNISSYLDALKTAEHLAKRDKAEEVINLETTPVSPVSTFLDELDMATVRSMVTYFEQYAPNTIRRYHRDHNATYDEAEAICKKCLEIASQFQKVKTKEDLKNVIQSVEILKSKVSRYQHHHYEYRWTTHLQKDVLDKLVPILTHL